MRSSRCYPEIHLLGGLYTELRQWAGMAISFPESSSVSLHRDPERRGPPVQEAAGCKLEACEANWLDWVFAQRRLATFLATGRTEYIALAVVV